MLLSIAIVNWNTTYFLATCLRSIKENPPGFDYEVVVVDNSSNDFDEARMRADFPEVVFIANERNEGYARGNNQAIATAKGEFVLLLNPDTEIHAGALDALVSFMQNHPHAGAAGCKLIRPNGEVERSCRSFPGPKAIAYEVLGLSKLFPKSAKFAAYRMTYFDYSRATEVDQPMGSCLILSKKAIEDVGLLDDDFPIFFNEVDWLLRAKQKGWRVYFTPDAVVTHHGGASTHQVRNKMVQESHKSLIKFYEKHYKKRLSPPVYAFIMMAIKSSAKLRPS
jgi:GT2 family glycosyltransferase